MKLEELLMFIENTLDKLYIEDRYLFQYNAREEAIVARFYYLLRTKFELNGYRYDIDNEYNCDKFAENGRKGIIFDDKEKCIIPDLIIHKRGSNEDNLAVIEFKKTSNKKKKDRDWDETKLKFLTRNSLRYKYKYGFLLTSIVID